MKVGDAGGTGARSRGPLSLPKIAVLVGMGMGWMLMFGSALGVMLLPGGALLVPAVLRVLLFLPPGTAQTANFNAAAANDTVVASVPALHGGPQIECPKCDTLFGRLARTELNTNVQDIHMQVCDIGKYCVRDVSHNVDYACNMYRTYFAVLITVMFHR